MAGRLPHQIQWVTASPLWSTASAEPVRMRAPQLLCFESERFMEQLIARLQALPGPDLSAHLPGQPLKLFQPAHGRFYLVAAHLVCRLAGMPDHVVDAARGERIAFVLRRLDAKGAEQAWVPAPRGTSKQRHLWVSRSEKEQLAPDEELFPMFPVSFTQEGRRRRMLAGFVPASNQEAFQSAGAPAPREEARYVIRCVYLRPRCGALTPPIVSEPTVDFSLAAFSDPDAPGRPTVKAT